MPNAKYILKKRPQNSFKLCLSGDILPNLVTNPIALLPFKSFHQSLKFCPKFRHKLSLNLLSFFFFFSNVTQTTKDEQQNF